MAALMFHLPDLPNVGYSTTRDKTGSDQIMLFMRDIERNRLRLLNIVIDGRDRWRTVARSVFGTTLNIDDEAVDAIYDYFTLQAARPPDQWRLLQAQKAGNRDRWREIVKEIMPDIEEQREAVRLVTKWQP